MNHSGASERERSIAQFVEVASRYCAWAEGDPADPREDMHTARALLAGLQLAILGLPDDFPETDTPEDMLTSDDWKCVRSRFVNLPVDGYWDVFDPLEKEDPVFNLLSDDLADIWRDIKEGVILYEMGEFEEAVWTWRFNFEIHWGRHLTGALRAIHAYLS